MLCLLLITGFLCILSVSDIHTKTIPGWAAPLFGAGMIILHLFLSDLSLPECLAGLIPGAVLLILSVSFRSQIGTGDGTVVLACGLATGFERTFAALTAALVFCAVFSGILLLLRRIRRSDSLPFLPFLAAAHVLMVAVQGASALICGHPGLQ